MATCHTALFWVQMVLSLGVPLLVHNTLKLLYRISI